MNSHKIWYRSVLLNCKDKLKISFKWIKMRGTLHRDLHEFLSSRGRGNREWEIPSQLRYDMVNPPWSRHHSAREAPETRPHRDNWPQWYPSQWSNVKHWPPHHVCWDMRIFLDFLQNNFQVLSQQKCFVVFFPLQVNFGLVLRNRYSQVALPKPALKHSGNCMHHLL
jgi:hypothetical protein